MWVGSSPRAVLTGAGLLLQNQARGLKLRVSLCPKLGGAIMLSGLCAPVLQGRGREEQARCFRRLKQVLEVFTDTTRYPRYVGCWHGCGRDFNISSVQDGAWEWLSLVVRVEEGRVVL